MLVLWEIKQEKKYEGIPYKLYLCIGILSKDLNKTISFYCNELGMTVEDFTTDPGAEIRKCLKFEMHNHSD